jgi:hypothetical protein
MDQQSLEKLLDKCLAELDLAHNGKCEPDRAERTAALFLEMQFRLSEFLSASELKAKMKKSEVESVSGVKYFEYKTGSSVDKKPTEASLDQSIAKDADICKLKEEMFKYEAEVKKWNYVMNILSNGHIYFRNLGKREFGT